MAEKKEEKKDKEPDPKKKKEQKIPEDPKELKKYAMMHCISVLDRIEKNDVKDVLLSLATYYKIEIEETIGLNDLSLQKTV